VSRGSDLFPKLPRRIKQPRKEALRTQLRIAADEIIRLRTEAQTHRNRLRLIVDVASGTAIDAGLIGDTEKQA